MFRIRLLCRLAVCLGLMASEAPARLIAAYKAELKQNSGTAFMPWAIKNGWLTQAQSQQVRIAYQEAQLDCNTCGTHFRAGDTDMRKGLACPTCNGSDLILLEGNIRVPAGELLTAPPRPLTINEAIDVNPGLSSAGVGYGMVSSGSQPVAPNAPRRPGSQPGSRSGLDSSSESDPSQTIDRRLLRRRTGSGSGPVPTAAAAASGSRPGRGSDTDNLRASAAGTEESDDDHTGTVESLGRPRSGVARPQPPAAGSETSASPPVVASPSSIADPDALSRPSSVVAHARSNPSNPDQVYGDSIIEAPSDTATHDFGPPFVREDIPRPSSHSISATSAGTYASPLHTDSGRNQDFADIPTGTVIAGCRIIRKLGQGGMGAVYAAHHINLDKAVAVKLLAPHLVENSAQVKRFIREGRSAAKIEHPNVVLVHDVGEEKRRFYIIMQWIDGESLQDLLTKVKVLPMDQAVEFMLQAARGIESGHKLGIIHRDIKPDNLMLTRDGVVKVTDFGLAKQTEQDLDVSRTGMILGTPYYMSPEQGQNVGVDHRSDIYSLGIALYQLLTGKVPFTGTSAVQIIVKHIKERMVPPRRLVPAIPERLEKIVLKMTAKEPTQRFQSMGEVIRALESVRGALVHEAPDLALVPEPEAVASESGQLSEEEQSELVTSLRSRRRAERAKGQAGPKEIELPEFRPPPKRSGVGLLIATLLLLAAGGGFGYWYFIERPKTEGIGPVGPSDATEADDTGTPIASDGIPTDGTPSDGAAPDAGAMEPTPDGTVSDGATDGSQSQPISPEERAERRRQAADTAFAALLRNWERDRSAYNKYADYEEDFRDLYTRFGDVPAIHDRVDAQLDAMNAALRAGAAEWLQRRDRDYERLIQQKAYVRARDVIREFPTHFGGTPTAIEVEEMRTSIQEDVRREEDAEAIFNRLDRALDREATEVTVTEAAALYEQLADKEYRESRFAERLPGLLSRLDRLREAYAANLSEGAANALSREISTLRIRVNDDLSENNFASAMRRILGLKERVRLTRFQAEVDRLEQETRSAATDWWTRIRTTAEQAIAAAHQGGEPQPVFDALDRVTTTALPEHQTAARSMRNAFIDEFVTRRLSEFEEDRNGAEGIAAADRFLAMPAFQRQRPRIEAYRARFDLLRRGFVPVRVTGGTVTPPYAESGAAPATVGEYWIQAREVTNQQFYDRFASNGGYEERRFWTDEGWARRQEGLEVRGPDGWQVDRSGDAWRFTDPREASRVDPNKPVRLSVWEAEAYAAATGAQLPSRLQWTIAAGYDPTRVAEGAETPFRIYPWGDEATMPDGGVPANVATGQNPTPTIAPVGSRPQDRSFFGLYDMGGNVAEWTRDPGEDEGHRIVCGGSALDDRDRAAEITRVTHSHAPYGINAAYIGFRTVATAPNPNEIGPVETETPAEADSGE